MLAEVKDRGELYATALVTEFSSKKKTKNKKQTKKNHKKKNKKKQSEIKFLMMIDIENYLAFSGIYCFFFIIISLHEVIMLLNNIS